MLSWVYHRSAAAGFEEIKRGGLRTALEEVRRQQEAGEGLEQTARGKLGLTQDARDGLEEAASMEYV